MKWFNKMDMIAAIGFVMILIMMVIPIPPFMLDLLLSFNISFSLMILLVSMYISHPLELSAFPSILLMATLFRLSLNISSTRLILLHGDRGPLAAGRVIHSFGQFVVGGNYVVGFIVFLILVVINFIVITKGAGRIAEVAARFTLDAMPGKQMSIDADLNAGIIDEKEARRRREEIAREADFYGAMDGASKFVRGDAIASLIITAINILAGLIIGVLQKGMPITKAAHTYTILTVGDGLVSQIPALIVSTAAGIVISRASSTSNLAEEMGSQLFSYPKAIQTASFILLGLGLVPGLPHIPFLILGLFMGAVGLLKDRLKGKVEEVEEEKEEQEEEIRIVPPDPISIEIGYRLISLVDVEQGGDILERIKMIRKKYAQEKGFILPPVRIKDNLELSPNEYVILIKGVEVARGELMIGHYLAINPGNVKGDIQGIPTTDPVFGLPSKWIKEANVKTAKELGYTVVDPATVLMTHFTEVVKSYCHELLDREEVQALIDNIKQTHPRVVEELIPNLLTLGAVQKVLQNLLKEQVPIRDLVTILEALADYASVTKDPDILTEYVRERIGRHIVKQYLEDGKLYVATLDHELERIIEESIKETSFGPYPILPPDILNEFISELNEKIKKLGSEGHLPIILCSPNVRRYVRRLTERSLPNLIVLSYSEIPREIKINSVGIIRVRRNEDKEVSGKDN